MNSADVPMATPPARVAFWICTCQVKTAKQLSTLIDAQIRYKCEQFQREHYHIQFSSLLRHAGDGHGGEDRGSQSNVSVDGCSVLSIAVVSDGRVETWPEHPQEQRTCEAS